jgi:hypothetical protein
VKKIIRFTLISFMEKSREFFKLFHFFIKKN